jgi:hypothetical protein
MNVCVRRLAKSRSRRIYAPLAAMAAVLTVSLGATVATAGAVNVLEQGWENPANGLTSDLPTTGCGGTCMWTRNPQTGTPLANENAAVHNFWHVQAEPQTNLIKVPDINPNLVQLAPGDNGHLPSAFAGTHVAWFGEPSTGTFCGSDFETFAGAEQNLIASLNGCTSSAVELGELISPQFSLKGASSAIMHFFSWWEIESVNADRFDLMGVDYSTDGGATWTPAGLLNPGNNPAGQHYQAYSNTGLQSPPQWKEYLVDLTPAIGSENVKVRFTFDTKDELYNGFRGWLIDSVRVTTPFDVPNPAITSVDTCAGTTVVPVTVIHGTNFLLGSKISVDGGEALTAQTPSSDRIEIPVISTGPHTIQVIDPNGTIKSNVFSVTQPSNCSPALPPTPPKKNETPPNNPPVEEGNPIVDESTGEIVFNENFPEAGNAVASGEVVDGASLSRFQLANLSPFIVEPRAIAAKAKKGKSKKCKKGFVKKGKKCVSNAPVQYGATSLTAPGAGKYKLRIKPSGRALAALQRGKTLKVKATILFTPKGIASPFVHVVNVNVHLKKAKKKHGKGKGKKGKK